MDVALIMFRDDGEHRPFTVTKAVTTIGRREDCDLRIAVGDVSRKHCKLTVEAGAIHVEDLGSSNGTFVNGTRVAKASPVRAGDVLKVGPVVFVVQVDGEPIAETVDARVTASRGDAPKPPAAPAKPARKAAAIDGEIDELSILNDSGGDSSIAFNLDDSKS